MHDPNFNRFWLIHPCDRQTDRRRDGIAIAYARLAYMLSRAKIEAKVKQKENHWEYKQSSNPWNQSSGYQWSMEGRIYGKFVLKRESKNEAVVDGESLGRNWCADMNKKKWRITRRQMRSFLMKRVRKLIPGRVDRTEKTDSGSCFLRAELVGDQARVTTAKEEVLSEGWREIKWCRQASSLVLRNLKARERILYSVRSLILSQWRDLRMGVMWVNLGALTTAWAQSSESVGAFGTLEDCNTENYNSQVWSVQWKLWEDWMFWNQGKERCREVRECEYSRI